MPDLPTPDGLDEGITLRVEPDGRRATLTIVGFVDLDDLHDLRTALLRALQADTDDLVVDLAAARWINSAGLGALAGAHRRMTARGGRLVLWRPPLVLASNLRMLGLDRVIPVVDEP